MFFLNDLPTKEMISSYTGTAPLHDVKSISDGLFMMRRASILVRKIDRYFAAQKLSQLQFLILVVIDREPKRTSLRPSEILEKLDVSKPVLHRTIKTLVSSGLITEKLDREDARASQLSLTSTGKEKLTELLPNYFQMIIMFMNNTDTQRF